MIKTIRLALIIAVAILSGCLSILKNERTNSCSSFRQWVLHQKKIRNLNFYQARGVLTYVSDRKKFHSRFFLQEFNENCFRFLLTGPLGSTIFRFSAKLDPIQIQNSKKKNFFSSKEEETFFLIKKKFPLRSIYQWLLGLPGGATEYELNDQCFLGKITYIYNGESWKVVYRAYSRRTEFSLPSDIEFSKGRECVKMKINDWFVK